MSDASKVLKEAFMMDTWTIESITASISVACRVPRQNCQGSKIQISY